MKAGVSFPPRTDGSDDRYPPRLEKPTRHTLKLELITLKSSVKKKKEREREKIDLQQSARKRQLNSKLTGQFT
jgi:hypothetical protein